MTAPSPAAASIQTLVHERATGRWSSPPIKCKPSITGQSTNWTLHSASAGDPLNQTAEICHSPHSQRTGFKTGHRPSSPCQATHSIAPPSPPPAARSTNHRPAIDRQCQESRHSPASRRLHPPPLIPFIVLQSQEFRTHQPGHQPDRLAPAGASTDLSSAPSRWAIVH